MIAVAVPVEAGRAGQGGSVHADRASAALGSAEGIADGVTLSLTDAKHTVVARSADNLTGLSAPTNTVAAAAA
jgi:hypothetical protein